jgi:hypothetical protein
MVRFHFPIDLLLFFSILCFFSWGSINQGIVLTASFSINDKKNRSWFHFADRLKIRFFLSIQKCSKWKQKFETEAKVRKHRQKFETEAKVRNRSKSRIRSKSSKAFWLRFLQRQLLVDEVQLQDLVSLELKRGQSL